VSCPDDEEHSQSRGARHGGGQPWCAAPLPRSAPRPKTRRGEHVTRVDLRLMPGGSASANADPNLAMDTGVPGQPHGPTSSLRRGAGGNPDRQHVAFVGS
jgi:hypothetical protein